ncbi:hypothetical protein GCM10010193_57760 [Kitasatospora atroaurantiaca]
MTRSGSPVRCRPLRNSPTPNGRTVTFQLWDWHDDGERYDLEHFQLIPDGEEWRVRVRRTTCWALARQQLTGLATEAGFIEPAWESPETSGFFQPVLTARVP